MKNFQQNLLILLALCLCGLCAWQWYFQTTLRQAVVQRNDRLFKLDSDIQGYTNSINNMGAEINSLQTRVADLKRQGQSNNQQIVQEQREVLRLQSLADIESNEIQQYQAVTNALTGELLKAAAGIDKQNDAIKTLVAQRDEFVKKYNDSVKARNDLTDKYNALVERLNKLQAAPPQQ